MNSSIRRRSLNCTCAVLGLVLIALPVSAQQIAPSPQITGGQFAAGQSGLVAPPSLPPPAITVRDICRVKGQERNSLEGIGLVVGLNGTGDTDPATVAMLARLTQSLGGSIGTNAQGFPNVADVAQAANVASVVVSVELPPSGAQQGDLLDCEVNAISASSLAGGRLIAAYMLGPRTDQPQIYAISRGRISMPDADTPTSGVIYKGCKMETNVMNGFFAEDTVTLILDADNASFSNAASVEQAINEINGDASLDSDLGSSESYIEAQAIDQMHIEVKIPPVYKGREVDFIALLMEQPLSNLKNRKVVTINERRGIVVVGEDVVISPVAINHKSLSIEVTGNRPGFVGLDLENPKQARPRLKNLQDALNALDVPTKDVIDIILTLHKHGQLFGEIRRL
ncbi:MAG TPA: flagellar biosynthesis protein FlgI [Planctomycetaceae bacterium]|nr:flagellar biosynthesis protein FlgI [Planctomycetaceae bacterium]